MAGKSNTWENELLLHLFNNAAVAGVGDGGGLLPSAAPGSLYVSLHTADPGEAGAQNTSEATFGAYARVAVARSGSGWAVSGAGVDNVAAILFPECTSGSETITHFGVGTASSGAGKLLYSAALTTSRLVDPGEAVNFPIGALDVTED